MSSFDETDLSLLRPAVQTIVWGRRFESKHALEEAFRMISSFGFQGVEIAQHPASLGVDSYEELLEVAHAHSLEVIGLAGGSLSERQSFAPPSRDYYLYCDDRATKNIRDALNAGFRVAMHPHIFTSIPNYAVACQVFESGGPKLEFIPDTAHMYLAGDDTIFAIRDQRKRLAALHLKDWRPDFGRSSFRYAKGFMELGGGEVDLLGALRSFASVQPTGWVVWELDRASGSMAKALRNAHIWFAGNGFPPAGMADESEVEFAADPKDAGNTDPNAVYIHRAGSSLTDAARLVVDQIHRTLGGNLTSLWSVAESRGQKSLLTATSPTRVRRYSQKLRDTLCKDAISAKRSKKFDLVKFGKGFAEPRLLDEFPSKYLVSVPIPDSYNCNHVRYVVNCLTDDAPDEAKCLALDLIADRVSSFLESALDNECNRGAMAVHNVATKSAELEDFLHALIFDVVLEEMDCVACTIFLADPLLQKLEPCATTGLEWTGKRAANEFYKPNEGEIGNVWTTGQPFFRLFLGEFPKGEGWHTKAVEVAAKADDFYDVMVVPISGPSGRLGVIRCANKRPQTKEERRRVFTDDDSARLDAVCDAAAHYIQYFLKLKHRSRASEALQHTLRQAGLANFNDLATIDRHRGGAQLKHDYLDDITSWNELIQNVVRDPTHTLGGSRSMLKQSRTFLLRDIVAAVVRQCEGKIQERRFSPWSIDYSELRGVPMIFVDRNKFQQVFFNLITNAIKYAHDDANQFKIKVGGELHSRGVYLRVQDWGIGIPAGSEDAVFDVGTRFVDDNSSQGDGFGLAVCRKVVQNHDGWIRVTNCREPTEFTIHLPLESIVRPIQGL